MNQTPNTEEEFSPMPYIRPCYQCHKGHDCNRNGEEYLPLCPECAKEDSTTSHPVNGKTTQPQAQNLLLKVVMDMTHHTPKKEAHQ